MNESLDEVLTLGWSVLILGAAFVAWRIAVRCRAAHDRSGRPSIRVQTLVLTMVLIALALVSSVVVARWPGHDGPVTFLAAVLPYVALVVVMAIFLRSWRHLVRAFCDGRCLDTASLSRQIRECSLLFERAPFGVFMIDRSGVISSHNRKMNELLGLDQKASLVGQNLLEMPACRQTELGSCLHRGLAGQSFEVEFECLAVSHGDRHAWRHCSGIPLFEPGLKIPYGLMLVVTDISHRKALERDHLNILAENSPIVVYAVNKRGVYTMHEGQALESLGLKPGDGVGRRPEEVYPEAPQVADNFRWALAGEPFAASVKLRNRYFDAYYVPTRDEAGQVDGVIGFAHDVTDANQSSERLQQAIALLETTLEATDDGILVVDLTGQMVRANHKFAEMWHLPKEIMESKDDQKALKHAMGELKDPVGFIRRVNELYAQPDASSDDVLEFADGRICRRYSQPHRLNGVVVGRVWSFHDITEQRRAEFELRQRNAELEKTAHFLAGRELQNAEMKREFQELRRRCGTIKGKDETRTGNDDHAAIG